MTVGALKTLFEALEQDFKNIPDSEKDFATLQDRLEVLIKRTSDLSKADREPLMPILERLHQFLKDHLEEVQKQASLLQVDLQGRTTHMQAIKAYGKFKT